LKTLQILNNEIQFTELSGKDCLKQRLQNRIALYLGEWALDLTAGIDWFSVLGYRNIPIARYEELVRSAIIQDTEVIRINSLTVELLNSTEKVAEYNNRTGKNKRLGEAVVEWELDSVYGIIDN
jgi:hypothetical protein